MRDGHQVELESSRSLALGFCMLMRALSPVAFLSVCPVVWSQADSTQAPATMLPSEIAETVGHAVVVIKAKLADGSLSTGTGFIVDASGVLVTNFHVVEAAERVDVRLKVGDVYEVSGVRAVDRDKDIAVLQIPAFGLPIVKLGVCPSNRFHKESFC